MHATHAQGVAVSAVRADTSLQPRASMDLATIAEYAAAMGEGASFPPVVVFREGDVYWLADGFHRVAAARQVGVESIAADVREGTRRDAVLHSVGANADHGLRRTNADKRRAVETLLRDPEWAGWADGAVAVKTRTTQPFVSKIRRELTQNGFESPAVRRGLDGRTIDTAAIGRRPEPAPLARAGLDAEGRAVFAPVPPMPAPRVPQPLPQPEPVEQEADEYVDALADLPRVPTGAAAIEALRQKQTLAEASKIRAAQAEERRQERIEKIAQIETGNAPLEAPSAPCHVLLADPPWRYEHAVSVSREIENQYPTMSLEEIRALPVGEVCAADAVLFLWATSPKLAEAMSVLEAWGFTYRTCMVWVKDRVGMGYYARQRHELLLIATRGAGLPVPRPEDRPDSVIEAPRGEHSAKPPHVHDLIAAMYPAPLRRLEMFSRAPRDGWAAWGNQSEGRK